VLPLRLLLGLSLDELSFMEAANSRTMKENISSGNLVVAPTEDLQLAVFTAVR
jgi:hypothetical protein